MADVAERAGVSLATVSRALSGKPGVGEATRERICQVAEELSYVVSPEAAGLARGRTGRIAVVVPRIDVWFYSAMLASVSTTLRDEGIDVLVYQVDGPAQRAAFFRDLPSRRKADAVVLIALPILEAEADRLDLLGVDVVVAGGRLLDLPHVEIDDRSVAHQAVEHLVALGHERIAFIRTGDTEGAAWSADIQRTQGFSEAMEAAGLMVPPDYIVTEPYGVHAGAAAIERLLDLPAPPTAVFAYSDEIAISALAALHRRGLRCPDDLSLMGVDGHPLGTLFDLTTIDQFVDNQARLAAHTALALVRGEDPPQGILLPHELIVRGTTGSPPPE